MVYYRWLEKWKRDRRKGYRKFLYPNETTVSKSSPVDKDKVTMYAQWEAIQYTVLYDGNGGTGKMGNQTVTYGIATRLNKNQYQRNGYKFKGWNAYRESDKKWYTTDGWRSGKEIEEKRLSKVFVSK